MDQLNYLNGFFYDLMKFLQKGIQNSQANYRQGKIIHRRQNRKFSPNNIGSKGKHKLRSLQINK